MQLFINHREITGWTRTRFAAMASGLGAVALLACVLAVYVFQPRAVTAAASPVQQHQAMRVGTYDSRAVAVAYVRSDAFAERMRELQQRRAAAEKAGDADTVAQLSAQGESMQVRIHLQGFSDAPIDDVLDAVRDKLPGMAQRMNVSVIARAADYHEAASVELVDVTDELVRLFNPDKQTWQVLSDLRKQKPQAIEDVARMPARK